MKRIAVVLSGSGVYDGAEIQESVITLLALDRRGADVKIFAPDIPQYHVINHLNGETMAESRNVLVESARIARGNVTDLKIARAADFDAVIFPGGFGAAKNLCTFAMDGPDCSVNSDVERFIREALELKKALGFVCIAPALLAKVASGLNLHPELTIGDDADTASAIEALGGIHMACPAKDFVIDRKNRIVSTPAYMTGQSIREVAEGIEKLVDEVLALCD